jgi:hypothetical protein
MSAKLFRILIALCGILGTVLFGWYFGVVSGATPYRRNHDAGDLAHQL